MKVKVVEAEIPLFIGRKFLDQFCVIVRHGKGTAVIGNHEYRMSEGEKGNWMIRLDGGDEDDFLDKEKESLRQP